MVNVVWQFNVQISYAPRMGIHDTRMYQSTRIDHPMVLV